MPPPRVAAGTDTGATTVLHVVAGDDGLADIASVVAALQRRGRFRQVVVDASRAPVTGLDVPTLHPGLRRHLDVPGATHAERTAAALTAFETLLLEERPDVMLIAGDDDAALAAALAAAKLSIAIAHLGSGLRCWDWSLPDEVNRSVIDRLSDTLFTFSEDAAANLRREGVADGRVHAVGNTRIDMLRRYEGRARARAAWSDYGAQEREYTLAVLERESALRPHLRLEAVATALGEVAADSPVLLMPRGAARAIVTEGRAAAVFARHGIRVVVADDYATGLSLLAGAGAIITDGGAVQEDASALGVHCYTALPTTARSVTLTHGTNVLLGDDPVAMATVRPSSWDPTPAAIPLWDGHAGERVADALAANYAIATAFAGDR